MASNRQMFEIGSTAAVVVCAVAAVAMQAQRFSADQQPVSVRVDNWREEVEGGIWVGTEDSEDVVTVFVDFTCPYCRSLQPTLDSLRLARGSDLAVVYHHYSLNREWSNEAAVAAECVHRQGRFPEGLSALYAAVQDPREGPPDWMAVARDAGVRDLAAFRGCIQEPLGSHDRIALGREIGTRHGVTGTPTIWVNGYATVRRDRASLESLLKK